MRKTNWRDRAPFRSIRASIKRGTINEGPKPEKPAPPPGVAVMEIGPNDTPMVPAEHLPKIRKARKPKAEAPHIVAEHLGVIPEIVHTITGFPINEAISALKAELDAVTSIRSEDFGWVLNQGDDVLAVISHGKLTNRALVASINNRSKPPAS